MTKDAIGCAHGRFQPFHNGHLEYVLNAKQRCDFLWIGITRYDTDPDALNAVGRARDRAENNPLTYHERVKIITSALVDEGVERETFAFVPFPIEHPHKLHQFVPSSIPCYTTICEPWNKEKITLLESAGYTVHVLWERIPKIVSGSLIRDMIRNGNPDWHALVPTATRAELERLDFSNRLALPDSSNGPS